MDKIKKSDMAKYEKVIRHQIPQFQVFNTENDGRKTIWLTDKDGNTKIWEGESDEKKWSWWPVGCLKKIIKILIGF